MVEDQKREHRRLEQELQKFATLEQEYFDAEREMEQVQGEIMHMKERTECGIDYINPAAMSTILVGSDQISNLVINVRHQ
jgi:hypothetical protein